MTTRGVTNAIIAKLGADAQLLALLPNGVYRAGRAPEGSTALVEVSLQSSSDAPMFGGRASEDLRYLVQAIQQVRRGAVSNVGAAYARIETLLENQTLPALTEAGVMIMQRTVYFEDDTDIDDRDPSLVWDHCGGIYQVMVTVASGVQPPPAWVQTDWIQSGWVQAS